MLFSVIFVRHSQSEDNRLKGGGAKTACFK